MGKCKGTTVENRPCKRFSVLGGSYCFSHCEKAPTTGRKKTCADTKKNLKKPVKETIPKKVVKKDIIKKPKVVKNISKADFSEVSGTSLKGSFSGVPYSYLVERLGNPHLTDIDEIGPGIFKTKAMWIMKSPKGMVFTIYDSKEYTKPIEKTKRWFIGGKNNLDLKLVGQLIGLKTTPVAE